MALAARATRRYVDDPRCHSSQFYVRVMQWLLSGRYLGGTECIRSIWSCLVESKLGHTVECVYDDSDDDSDDDGLIRLIGLISSRSSPSTAAALRDCVLIQHYADALLDTVAARSSYCPNVYGYCLSLVAEYVFGGAEQNSFSRRQVGMSILRRGNVSLTEALLAYKVEKSDKRSLEERREWLEKEE